MMGSGCSNVTAIPSIKQSSAVPDTNTTIGIEANPAPKFSPKRDATYTSETSVPEKTSNKDISSKYRESHVIENFIIVWLDSNINESNEDYLNSITQLRCIVNSIKTFTDPDECVDFLTEIKDEKIFLIVSGALGQQFVPRIEEFHQLDSIYVFCSDKSIHESWTKECRKVKGIFTQIEPICDALKRDVRQSDSDLTPISILTSSSGDTDDLNALDQSFMYSLILKEIFFEMDYDETARKELVDYCRPHYSKNKLELLVIDEFDRDYDLHSPIWWYTRDCFVYNMVNKALRTLDIETIIKMGFFILELHRQIVQVYFESDNQHPLIIYRGQGMLNSDFDKMKKNIGGLLSFNNFLSTSTNEKVSLGFARQSQKNPILTAILFRMEIDPSTSSNAFFAALDNLSYFADTEKEILFSMHTIFRIGQVQQIEENLWQVNLTLTNDNDQQLTRLTEQMRQETEGSTGWHRLAQLLCKMGEFGKAQEIYTTLLETKSDDNWRDQAFFHHQLGYIFKQKGNLIDGLSHYQQSLDIFLINLPSDDPVLASTYSNIGTIYKQQGVLDKALEQFQRALNIELHAPEPDQVNIATQHSNIGMVLKEQGKYNEALKSYERTLKLDLIHLPPNHPSLAITYNNIGMLYYTMKDYSTALSYYEKALEIEEKSLPLNHPQRANTHHNMATSLAGLGRYAEAIEHASRDIDIVRLMFESDHPEMQKRQNQLDALRAELS